MAKKGRKKGQKTSCTSSAHVIGNHVTVNTTCPIKGGTKAPCNKPATSAKDKHKVTHVPAPCKGLKKKARKECAKRVCAQRPAEYRDQCFKDAGVRAK